MLRLSDSVIWRKKYYIIVGGVYISALELCRKMKFRTYLHVTHLTKFFMLSRLSDFVVCSTNLYMISFNGKDMYLESGCIVLKK